MECRVFPLGSFPSYRYVVIFSEYNGKLLLSRHRERATFETQGGHIEPGESPQAAAARELWEESGAEDFSMEPLFDYWAEDSVSGASGVVFYARIKKLASLPPWEMAGVKGFSSLPELLTYPEITPVLFQAVREKGKFPDLSL